MKKFFKKLQNKCNAFAIRAKLTLAEKKAEGFVDNGIAIVISVVIGGLLLAGLYALFNTTIIPTMTEKISGMFNYAGT